MEKNLHTQRQNILLRLLRQCREDAELRQVDVAELLERPQSFVSKYESGERRLDILELHDVCRALQTDLSAFAAELERRLRKPKQRSRRKK